MNPYTGLLDTRSALLAPGAVKRAKALTHEPVGPFLRLRLRSACGPSLTGGAA